MTESPVLKKALEDVRLHLLLVVGFLFLLYGRPVPSGNEWFYQLFLIRRWHPDFLANDWTLGSHNPEHLIFNSLFGALTFLMSPEAVAWLGRILGWTFGAYTVFRLGRKFGLPQSLTTLALLFWLSIDHQAPVGAEWMFHGFEAKIFAYPFLFLALEGFLDHRPIRSALCVGICFSIHPAVGMWGGLSMGVAMLFSGWKLKEWLLFAAIAGIAALPGAIPLFSVTFGTDGSTPDDWKFMTLVGMPYHLDPFSWTKRKIVGLLVLFLFNLMHAWRFRQSLPIRLLALFQCGTAVWFALGVAARYAEAYPLLKFMPFRLFPVIVPLFFFFALAHLLISKVERSAGKGLILAGVLGLMAAGNPIAGAVDKMNVNLAQWRAPGDGFVRSVEWISGNTPLQSVCILPPWRDEGMYLSRRGSVVHFTFHTYDRLDEWRQRLKDLGGEVDALPEAARVPAMEAHYASLPPDEVIRIAAAYQADYLVSTGEYAFPVLFQSGNWRVYAVPAPAG